MIIVTGGAGFIGSALVAALNEKGRKDIVVVDALGTDDRWKNLAKRSFREFLHKDDFLSRIQNQKLPWEISAILHMGACSSTTERDADFLISNNYKYTQALCTFAAEKNIRFIYASSGATYGLGEHGYSDRHDRLSHLRPCNMYGYSKHLFDLWALDHGLLDSIAGVKFFNVFGPNEYHKGGMRSMVLRAYEQIKSTGTVKLFRSTSEKFTDGGQMRDFVYVKDCVAAVLWLMEHKEKNGIFNVGSGKARSWNDLAQAVFKSLGVSPKIEYIDMPPELRPQYQNFTEADLTKLFHAGYPDKFSSLEDAVQEYVRNFLDAEDRYL